jgi:hypothetical protein
VLSLFRDLELLQSSRRVEASRADLRGKIDTVTNKAVCMTVSFRRSPFRGHPWPFQQGFLSQSTLPPGKIQLPKVFSPNAKSLRKRCPFPLDLVGSTLRSQRLKQTLGLNLEDWWMWNIGAYRVGPSRSDVWKQQTSVMYCSGPQERLVQKG